MRPKISEPVPRSVIMQPWMKIVICIGLFGIAQAAVFFAFEAYSKELLPGPYEVEVLSVYDGDTFTVRVYPGRDFNVSVWPDITYQLNLDQLSIKVSVRLRGVDTPEIRGKCQVEKEQARMARDFVVAAISDGVTLSNVERGKYAGRVIADVTLPGGRSLTEELIDAGLGRPYDGGKRDTWCQ